MFQVFPVVVTSDCHWLEHSHSGLSAGNIHLKQLKRRIWIQRHVLFRLLLKQKFLFRQLHLSRSSRICSKASRTCRDEGKAEPKNFYIYFGRKILLWIWLSQKIGVLIGQKIWTFVRKKLVVLFECQVQLCTTGEALCIVTIQGFKK